MRPDVSGTSPSTARMRVVLPAPLGPMSARDPPAWSRPVMPSSTTSRPKAAVAPSRRSTGSAEVVNELTRVVPDGVDVGVALGALGAEAVAEEGVLAGDHGDAGLAPDGAGDL